MTLSVLNTLLVAISWCVFGKASSIANAASLPPSNDNNITARQSTANADSTCFTDRGELRNAISQFLNDGCSDDNNCNNTVVQEYGWPIGSWCVSNVTDMRAVFYDFKSFNQDWFVQRSNTVSNKQ